MLKNDTHYTFSVFGSLVTISVPFVDRSLQVMALASAGTIKRNLSALYSTRRNVYMPAGEADSFLSEENKDRSIWPRFQTSDRPLTYMLFIFSTVMCLL